MANKCDGYTCTGDLHDQGCSLGGMRQFSGPGARVKVLEEALRHACNYIILAVQDESGRKEEVVDRIRRALLRRVDGA